MHNLIENKICRDGCNATRTKGTEEKLAVFLKFIYSILYINIARICTQTRIFCQWRLRKLLHFFTNQPIGSFPVKFFFANLKVTHFLHFSAYFCEIFLLLSAKFFKQYEKLGNLLNISE